MIKIFYHDDADGRASAAIAYRYFNKECYLYAMDYTKEFNFKEIYKDDVVFMLDYGLQPFDLMLKLKESCFKLIWIDHHISAITNYKKLGVTLMGIRDSSYAACMLTWKNFYPVNEAPLAIKYIEDRDIWKWKYEDDTRFFYAGLELYDYAPESSIWDDLLGDNSHKTVCLLCKEGAIVDRYKVAHYKEVVTAFGFPLIFEGYTNCYACNQGMAGSDLFKSLAFDYDIVIPFVYDGNSKLWRISLFSKIIDVSEIAVKFGGGGHKRAAGFESTVFPF
jgi:uncharacterized protein